MDLTHLHVGRGTTRGALTVFPVWAQEVPRQAWTTETSAARVTEITTGAEVGRVLVVNHDERPLVLLEGQLLEGGRQHRMVARSVVLPAKVPQRVEVVCVEAGRWDGEGAHVARGRRAAVNVRAALRTTGPDSTGGSGGGGASGTQGAVWERVSRYDARLGANGTSSYVEHTARAQAEVAGLVAGLHPFPGQVGVVVGIAGQPALAEIFATPADLARHLEHVVSGAALDAVELAPQATPARRAHRFLDRAARLTQRPTARAGIGVEVTARDPYVDLRGLVYADQPVHTTLLNPRHALAA